MFTCAIHLRLGDGTGGAEGVIGEFISCNMMMVGGLGHFGGWPHDIFSFFVNSLDEIRCTRIREVWVEFKWHSGDIDIAIIAE